MFSGRASSAPISADAGVGEAPCRSALRGHAALTIRPVTGGRASPSVVKTCAPIASLCGSAYSASARPLAGVQMDEKQLAKLVKKTQAKASKPKGPVRKTYDST